MIKTNTRTLGLALMLATAAPALAAPAPAEDPREDNGWYRITDDKDARQLWVRMVDIQAGRPGQRDAKLWTKTVPHNDKSVTWDHLKVLMIVDCVAMTTRKVSFTTYEKDGTHETVADSDAKPEHVIPDTLTFEMVSSLCSTSTPAPAAPVSR